MAMLCSAMYSGNGAAAEAVAANSLMYALMSFLSMLLRISSSSVVGCSFIGSSFPLQYIYG